MNSENVNIENQEKEKEINNFVPEVDYISDISNELWFKSSQITVVLDLISEWSTVPFIARYRKEKTLWLDEDDIRKIIELRNKFENIYKAKVTATNGINEQWKLSDELLANILKAKTLKEVEDIYKPYKSKKKTKAMIAQEKWFQVVADEIKKNSQEYVIPDNLLKDYSKDEIIEGAIDIIWAEVSANSDLRADLLETLKKYNSLVSKLKTQKSLDKLNEKDKSQIPKFDIYKDSSIKISNIKPYQILALNRWEKLGILNVKIEKTPKTYEGIMFHYARLLKVRAPFINELESGFKIGYEALFSSVENELRSILSELAEDDAIDTFKQNLANLLMTKPEYDKKIFAIDPGFAAGCKMALLDEFGNPISFDKIYLHKQNESKTKLKSIIQNNNPWVIVVWNGTWVNETIKLLWEITDLDTYIVNESWASVYSASKIAKEEFPDLDSLDRWTISIGRRFIDPLSELVKVPVWSIWVGMYQHDMPEKKLDEKLGYTVEDVVNEVGINVNTASSHVLSFISGITKRSAKKIYNNRPYKSRKDLNKQLSPKVYEQAAWFLRVPDSEEKLDNTDIHPEQYKLAKYIIEDGITSDDYENNKDKIISLYPDATNHTIDFIINSFNDIWQDKRTNSTHKKANLNWDKVDIKEWDVLDWVIKNVLAFWAFVDIGTKQDGLVHISQITDSFVSDPKEILEVWQVVKVRILSIDKNSWKIQLSMKWLN